MKTAPTILVVVSDSDLRESLEAALARENYSVLSVRSPHSALIILRQFPGQIDLLITCEQLPSMSGPQLGRIAQRERENMHVLVVQTSDAIDTLLAQITAALASAALFHQTKPQSTRSHDRL